MEIFRVEDLNFTYPECSSKTVHDVSFKIGKGEFIVLCGSTGSGKSTLLRLLKPEISPNGEIIYGFISGIAYSFIMDIWTVLSYNDGKFGLKLYLAALTTAIPYTISYAVSNVIFLWFLAEPFGRKLKRIVKKYNV